MDHAGSGFVNVCDHGAVGDGRTDSTLAIRRALEATPRPGGVLLFPPGRYLTDTIYPPDSVTLLGHAAFGYQDPGGVVLSPVKATQPRLIDLNGKVGTRLVGLTLHGQDLGEDMDGVYTARPGNREQHVVIDNCRIEHFTGSGVAMGEAHVWTVRHCIIFANRRDGIDARNAFDGWIHDNQIPANGGCGIRVNNSVTITGNRIEHCGEAGILFNRHYSQHVQITGNLFCSNRGPALVIPKGNVRAISVTGNTLRNSGLARSGDPHHDCHCQFDGAQGLAFTGNALHVLWNDNPTHGLVLRGLVESIVSHNTLFKGATQQLILDEGGHRDSIIEHNPGSLKLPDDLDS